jgi:hypothetical protein
MFKKTDIIIYFFIAAALFITGSIAFKSHKSSSSQFEIYFDGKLNYVYPLSKERKIYIVSAPNGSEKIISENFTVWKEFSSCNRPGICSHRKIRVAGDSIICLPNREIIKIRENGDYDYIIK